MQIGDGGLRIVAQSLRQEFARGGPLQRCWTITIPRLWLRSHSRLLAMDCIDSSMCCRWLLMTRDRVGSDDIQLTHEFLAIMLALGGRA